MQDTERKRNNATRQGNEQIEQAELLPAVTDFRREVLDRLQLSGKKDKRKLKEIAHQIGGEVVEFMDDTTGSRFFCSRDEFILRKFLQSIMKTPTPSKLLAWQKLKGEDIAQYGNTVTVEESGRSVADLKKELRQLLGIIDSATATEQILTPVRPQKRERKRHFPTVQTVAGDTAIIIDEDTPAPRTNRPRLSWQQ